MLGQAIMTFSVKNKLSHFMSLFLFYVSFLLSLPDIYLSIKNWKLGFAGSREHRMVVFLSLDYFA